MKYLPLLLLLASSTAGFSQGWIPYRSTPEQLANQFYYEDLRRSVEDANRKMDDLLFQHQLDRMRTARRESIPWTAEDSRRSLEAARFARHVDSVMEEAKAQKPERRPLQQWKGLDSSAFYPPGMGVLKSKK